MAVIKPAEPGTTCFFCEKPAVLVEYSDGCSICGGGDCGDFPDALPHCEEDARFFGLELPESVT